MGRYLASALAAMGLFWVLLPSPAQAGPVIHVGVSLPAPVLVAAPPPVVVVRPPCPGPNHVWVEGTWRRDVFGRQVWVGGHWQRAHRTVVVHRAPVVQRTVVVRRY